MAVERQVWFGILVRLVLVLYWGQEGEHTPFGRNLPYQLWTHLNFNNVHKFLNMVGYVGQHSFCSSKLETVLKTPIFIMYTHKFITSKGWFWFCKLLTPPSFSISIDFAIWGTPGTCDSRSIKQFTHAKQYFHKMSQQRFRSLSLVLCTTMFNSTARVGLRKDDSRTASQCVDRKPEMFAAETWHSTENVIKQATGRHLYF